MVTDEFPIGQTLTAVSIVEEEEFAGNELCLNQVQFFFQDITITLLPLADTDEIEIVQQDMANLLAANTPSWCQPFIGRKLMTIWVCNNDQGYQDQVIFAFDSLHPSISFIVEGSVIKIFIYEQIYKENKLAKTTSRADVTNDLMRQGLIHSLRDEIRNNHSAHINQELINLLKKLEDEVLEDTTKATPS